MTGQPAPAPLIRTMAGQERLAELARMRLHVTCAYPVPAGYITSQEAADRLGVSRRTIQRYRKILRQAGAGR